MTDPNNPVPLDDLYQEIILDHNKHPRNARVIDHPTHCAEGFNPLCGDEITVYLTVENGIIKDISFKGQGCAISKASASLMTELLKGRSQEEAHKDFEMVQGMLSGNKPVPSLAEMGDAVALAGVRQFPVRVKCATLAWHTMESALKGQSKVTTE